MSKKGLLLFIGMCTIFVSGYLSYFIHDYALIPLLIGSFIIGRASSM